MLFSIFDVLRIYEALQIFFYKFLLKWGKNEDFESSIFFEAQKYYFVFELRLNFFPIGHICNVVSTLPNVVKIDVENHNVVSTLSNVVQFNVDVRNVASMLIWRCATSRCHISLKTTLNRRWNVCWDKRSIATGIIENTLLDWFFFISNTSNRKKEINHYLANTIIWALPVTKEQVWQLEQ